MESLQRIVDVIALQNAVMLAEHWLVTEILVPATLFQAAAALAILALAAAAASRAHAWAERLSADGGPRGRSIINAAVRAGEPLSEPALALALLATALALAEGAGLPSAAILIATQLSIAWFAASLLRLLIRSAFWSRVVFWGVFAVAGLSLLGLLEATLVRLDQSVLRLGVVQLSALDLLRGAVQFAVLLWLALTAARLLEERVERATDIAPSLRVLTGKLLRFSLIAAAIVIALTSAGVDLTAFALFTGALGVALGFGMQKATSNLISGLMLLIDRSIKPGDVLELSDPNNRTVQLFGWVTSLNARYVSLTTRDGTEWLVPNDELISTRIVNWSYSHNRVRLLTPISVSFECDVKLAMRLATEAAYETPRVMHDPPPVVRLMGFEDSAVNLEMRFWIDDPANGIINVRSDVLVKVWERFRENGVRTPLGHRDLLLKDGSTVTVRMAPGGDG